MSNIIFENCHPALQSNAARVKIHNCTFINSGISPASSSEVDISNCTFQNSSSTFPAINANSGVLNISSSQFLFNNNSQENSGTVYLGRVSTTIDGCKFISNTARSGAGIYILDSNVSISNSSFESNKLSSSFFGGAIYAITSSISVTNCSFSSNYATYGSAIFTQTANGTISSSTFTTNSGQSAVYIYQGSSFNMVGNYFSYDKSRLADYSAALVIHNCNLGGNELSNSTFEHNEGRAVMLHSSQNVTLHEVIINNNTQAGGIEISLCSNVVVSNSQILNNNRANGGGMLIDKSNVSISTSEFYNNYASMSGGGINVLSGNTTIVSCRYLKLTLYLSFSLM